MRAEENEQTIPLTESVEAYEDAHPSLSSVAPDSDGGRALRRWPRWSPISLQNVVSFILGTFLCLAVVLVKDLSGSKTSSQTCSLQEQKYSPIFAGETMSYATVAFNGSFMRETIYRRPAAPDVDEAWDSLGSEYRPGVISESEAAASGLGKHYVKRAKEYGGGYFVQAEGLHHLHCLNLLRKSLYFNHKYYRTLVDSSFGRDEQINRYHITHCLDILRQVLMCNVDTGALGQVWTLQPGSRIPQAFPDFNTLHRCKDFEAVRKWGEKHQVAPDEELPFGFVAAPEDGDVIHFIP